MRLYTTATLLSNGYVPLDDRCTYFRISSHFVERKEAFVFRKIRVIKHGPSLFEILVVDFRSHKVTFKVERNEKQVFGLVLVVDKDWPKAM